MEGALSWIDLAVILIYFVFVLSVGWAVSRSISTGDDLFLAGRSLGVAAVGFSLFASNISSTTLIGLTGQAYSTGLSVANYELMAGFLLVAMAFSTIPVFLRLKMTTVPEYFERRFGGGLRKYVSVLTIFLTVFVDMAASVYAGVVVLRTFLPAIPFFPLSVGLAVIAGIYTAAGGLRAVVYTDIAQAIILLLGATVLTFILFGEFDYQWSNVIQSLPSGHLSLVRPLDDPALPWLGLVIGVPVLGWFYWSMNQYVIQRVLAARNIETAQRAAIFAGLLKLAPLFIMALPGAMALSLLPGLENSDQVFSALVAEFLPVGLAGLVIAGLIAAIMSTVDSTLNAATTLVLHDFLEVDRRSWSSERILAVGRWTTGGLMVIATLWPLVIREFPGVFSYIQQVFSYAVPPVVAVSLLGLFWRRARGRAMLATLIMGHAIGAGVFIYRASYAAMEIPDGLPHFTIVAGIATAVWMAVGLVLSEVMPTQAGESLEGVVRRTDLTVTARLWFADVRILGAVVAILTLLVIVVFR
ncbi:Na+/glucose cotransporter [Parvularcula bermudensis HTCC2503]|uniref:Na+/glucose cotransporter n=1 Tax=Parvularcula bermudensis (strain ATCC BAA-594 / HTCC2503 / KCTC 12087) TaxID=314260 RepID=E0TGV9_PARBH|nr:sodium:solute symporter [Parvularcula bermudensis]ADM10718.1 Na+/glucose cotransporter [Parvularcula bermudensis HTCC2503]